MIYQILPIIYKIRANKDAITKKILTYCCKKVVLNTEDNINGFYLTAQSVLEQTEWVFKNGL